MTTIEETIDQQSPIKGALFSGEDVLSADQTITFTKYVKVILPLDGFVFWVKADLISPSSLYNASVFNRTVYNNPFFKVEGANQVGAKGSLHHAIINRQDEDKSVAVNRMTFTSQIEIQDLNEVSPGVMYLAFVDGERFCFSERRGFYKRAGLYHYVGDAIYPIMEPQIIDNIAALDFRELIVSNSLPIWLSLNKYLPLYPSYLIPDNLPPPFASVHIDPRQTRALQAAPLIDSTGSHYQLVSDTVNLTFFGLKNFNALDFQDYLFNYCLNTDNMGIMNLPVIRDEKEWQTETSTLAMKKSMDVEVSYYQARIQDIARQYITSVCPTYLIGDPKPPMIFSADVALPYEGPFLPGEPLPVIIFLNTTTLARGVAYTESTGDGVFNFEDINGNVVITVTCESGNHNPQITFPQGPVTFYINSVLRPFAPNPGDSNLVDLTITFGDVPYTWGPQ